MAEEEDFDLDIDIYGDDKPPEPAPVVVTKAQESAVEPEKPEQQAEVSAQAAPSALDGADDDGAETQTGQADPSADVDTNMEHEVDAGATLALRLGEFEWWTTEEDIRGWANAAGVEAELVEVTFNEHKVNGKSKGEVFVEFQTPQATTAMRRHVMQLWEQQSKKFTAVFAQSDYNPFKGHGKDAATRTREGSGDRQPSNNNYQSNQTGGYNQGGYRGVRGGYARAGYQGRGGYNNGGYDNFNRGGFRGRGGMMGGMMGANMGMMGMGMMGMGMPMGMGGMGGMGYGGFQQGQFNQQQDQYNATNPHGAKRPRPEN